MTNMATDNSKIWRSPVLWTMIVIGLIIIASIYQYIKAPRGNVFKLIDVSNSAQVYSKDIIAICKAIDDQLLDNDHLISGKFADKLAVTYNAPYQDKQAAEECNKVTQKPPGIGKGTGTNFLAPLDTVHTANQHLRVQGNKLPIIAIVLLQAAEPPTGHKPVDPKLIKERVQAIAKEGYLAIIGPEVILQGQLSKALVGIPNVKICSFDQGVDCGVKWAFEQVRK
jgi:hypothetical protein